MWHEVMLLNFALVSVGEDQYSASQPISWNSTYLRALLRWPTGFLVSERRYLTVCLVPCPPSIHLEQLHSQCMSNLASLILRTAFARPRLSSLAEPM